MVETGGNQFKVNESKQTEGDQTPLSYKNDLWGLRVAVALIVVANLLTFAVLEGGYSHGKSIAKFSTIGGLFLVVMGTALFKKLRRSPADGMLIGVSLSLVGASANLTSNTDAIELAGSIAAIIAGPAVFLMYGVLLLRGD